MTDEIRRRERTGRERRKWGAPRQRAARPVGGTGVE